jgi:precorrin-2 dehydrogenase / sirohydrochlorin ferrochelatase
MLPIILDPARVRIALAGRGETFARRLEWLLAGGAERLAVYTDEPTPALEERLGASLAPRLPEPADLRAAQVVWLTGLPEAEAGELAEAARSLGVLVNVEDVTDGCDFHTPALVRRGDLLLTVSTAGKSPGLAARVRARLEAEYGPEWDERLDHLARKRAAWRKRPRALEELATLTDAVINGKGWLAEEAHW